MVGIEYVLGMIVRDLHIVAAITGAVYLLAFVCAVREIMNSRTSQGSIAWLLSLGLLPFPTAFLYLIFGWKFFDDYATDRIRNGRAARPLRAKDLALIDHEQRCWPVQTKVSEVPFLSGNEVELLIDGTATFDSIFEGISKAKNYLFVQFYIVRDDRLGEELAERLIERANAGVKVFLLYDDVGSTGMPKRFRTRLREAGVKVAGFNQRHKFLRFYGPTRINYRNHRKIVVVDGEVAWVGGHNVGVEYLGEDKRFGHWRDTHVRVSRARRRWAAPCCSARTGQWATGEILPSTPPAIVPTPGDQSVLVMGSGPADKLEECAIAFTDAISQARERLWIVSPYFVPDTDVRTALLRPQLRGVDVRIMLPERAGPQAGLAGQHRPCRCHGGAWHVDLSLYHRLPAPESGADGRPDRQRRQRQFRQPLLRHQFRDHPVVHRSQDHRPGSKTMLLDDFTHCRQVDLYEVRTRPLHMRFLPRPRACSRPYSESIFDD